MLKETFVKLRMENFKHRKTATNIGLAIWRLKCFYETIMQDSTAVILLNFSNKINFLCFDFPSERKAPKR